MLDGRLAEVALWTDDIGAAGFDMLYKGVSPLAVRPDALVFYAPLVGKYAPEIDIVASPHPRVYLPRRPLEGKYVAAPAAGGNRPLLLLGVG
jgi:hypothetical protein